MAARAITVGKHAMGALPIAMRIGVAMAVVGLGVAVAPLDTSVNVAFPAMTEFFGLELRAIQWVIVCYVLAYGGLMLVGGRLGDLHGYRRMFRLGLAISAVALTLCALAPTYPALLAARVTQGIGAALVLGTGPALATMLVAEERRTWAVSMYGAMAAGATAIGPLLGGLLVQQLGWQGVYWFRVPLVLVALALSFGLRPRGQQTSGQAFDLAGAALLAGSLAGVIVAAALARDIGAIALVPAAAGAGGLALFVRRQTRVAAPIIRPALFADPGFSAINLANILVNGAGFSVLLLAPYFMARIAGFGAVTIGLLLAVWAGGSVLGTLVVPPLRRGFSARPLALSGIGVVAIGLFLSSQWSVGAAWSGIAVALLLQGFGLGLFQVLYMDTVMATLPPADRGVAGSLAMLTRTLGTLSCAVGLSAWFAAMQAAGASFQVAFQTCFLAAAALVLAVGLALCHRRLLPN